MGACTVEGWRVLNWRDLTVALRFWRREMADRKVAQAEPAESETMGDGRAGFPDGPPKLGKISFPQWMLDKLPLEGGQG